MADNPGGVRVGPDNDESIASLIRRLTEQGAQLAHQQTELIRAEASEGLSEVTQGVASMAGAAIVAVAGLGVLLMAAAYGLAEYMPLRMATLIVAAVALLLALLLFWSGRKKMQSSSLSVERTRRTLERAPAAVTGQISEVNHHAR
jgi:sulfite exporter TauE/SafE